MITLSLQTVLEIVGGWILLSSAANAMSMTDRSFYGWLFRFLRLATNSAAPVLEKELGITLPTQVDATSQLSSTTK